MEIPRDFRPVDPTARRRQADAAKGPARAEEGSEPRADGLAAADSAAVERYVRMLQAHTGDPERLAALRQALAEGTFTATPEELVDPLLDRLDPPRD